jgi:lysophospholipase L1-like esterase
MRKYKQLLGVFTVFFLLFTSAKESYSETPLQYIAIGDSLTAGLGASEVEYLRIGAFVPSFVKYLREEEKEIVYVENHGIPGLTSSGLLTSIESSKGLQQRLKNSNIITVTIGGNDLLQLIRNDEISLTAAKSKLEDLEIEIKKIHRLLRSLNPSSSIYYVGLYNPYPEDHQYHDIAKIIIPMYNDLFYSLEDNNTIFVSSYEAFVGYESEYTHIAKDDIHPKDIGYEKITSALINAYTVQEQ